MKRVTVNTSNGSASSADLSADDVAAFTDSAAKEAASRAAETAYTSDLATRRAQVLADLQAIADATTLAGVRPPLLRTLRFILRVLREQTGD